MTADLQPVDIFAEVVGVMDRPTRQPQHFLLERTESGQVFCTDVRRLGHIHVPEAATPLKIKLRHRICCGWRDSRAVSVLCDAKHKFAEILAAEQLEERLRKRLQSVNDVLPRF